MGSPYTNAVSHSGRYLLVDDDEGHVQRHVGEIQIQICIGFELSGGEVLVLGRHAVDLQGYCQEAVIALVVQFVDHSVLQSAMCNQ